MVIEVSREKMTVESKAVKTMNTKEVGREKSKEVETKISEVP